MKKNNAYEINGPDPIPSPPGSLIWPIEPAKREPLASTPPDVICLPAPQPVEANAASFCYSK